MLQALEPVMPYDTPIVCLQNGVANEREALRHFPNVYGVCVVLPAEHLEPGVVVANAAPTTGILDIGRCAAAGSTTPRVAIADGVLVVDLRVGAARRRHALEVRQAPQQPRQRDRRAARERRAAESPAASRTGTRRGRGGARGGRASRSRRARRTPRAGATSFRWRGPAAGVRAGSSSWQSLARGTGAIETDYLNGEIVLLGRLHGVPTPVNAALQRLANDAARRGVAPGTTPVEDVIRAIEQGE